MLFPNKVSLIAIRTCSQYEYAIRKYLRSYLSPPTSTVVHGKLHCLPNTLFNECWRPLIYIFGYVKELHAKFTFFIILNFTAQAKICMRGWGEQMSIYTVLPPEKLIRWIV